MSQSNFKSISTDKWVLSNRIGKSRLQRLTSEVPFEDIVEQILKRAVVSDHKCEPYCKDPAYSRVVVTLTMDSKIVDLFHNSVCGYRAQYYYSAKNGERANRYATKLLAQRATELLSGKNKRTCPLWAVKMSLSDIHAKVWIHQGPWLRLKPYIDRNLIVKRWADKEKFGFACNS